MICGTFESAPELFNPMDQTTDGSSGANSTRCRLFSLRLPLGPATAGANGTNSPPGIADSARTPTTAVCSSTLVARVAAVTAVRRRPSTGSLARSVRSSSHTRRTIADSGFSSQPRWTKQTRPSFSGSCPRLRASSQRRGSSAVRTGRKARGLSRQPDSGTPRNYWHSGF